MVVATLREPYMRLRSSPKRKRWNAYCTPLVTAMAACLERRLVLQLYDIAQNSTLPPIEIEEG